MAVVAQLPHVKDTPDQFKYVILDDNLKETGKGEFSFAGNPKKIQVKDFLASDKGELFLIGEDYDKSFTYPVVYKATAGSASGSIIPVIIANPDQKNYNYLSSVNTAGQLVIAGYMHQKKTFSINDTKAIGVWLFNSSKPAEVKTFMFTSQIESLTARNIVFNDNTLYLIGEQYRANKLPSTGNAMQRLNAEEEFDYEHKDIMVTAFSSDGAKKFDIPFSRKLTSRNYDQDLMIASGIVNNKLALVFNDQYGKYFEGNTYKYYKLPVAVLINNDGLMEAPVNFAKELDTKVTSYTLMPQYFSSGNGNLVILLQNNETVKTATFK
nr:hypothetical protein [Mucilaginibacter sp. L294]